MKRSDDRSGFTLLELLIVIAILAVMATVAVLVINPLEYIKQTRDSKRIADFVSLNKSVQLFAFEKSDSLLLGSSTAVYISLPDNASSTCGSYTLPTLPSPWQYRCATDANLKKINGTGWLPIDLTSISSGSPLSALPVDPNNNVNGFSYYTYVTSGGFWEFGTPMESVRNKLAGTTDKESSDGGDDFTRYEVGNGLTIAPWSFEFTAFPVVANNSRQPGWYKYTGAGTGTAQGDAQDPHYMHADRDVWYGWQENIPYDPNALYKIECRARQVTDPITGGKSMYCGFNGIAADGVTLVNTTGSNSYGSQHYRAFVGTQLTAGAGWTTAVGYTRGYGAPNGVGGACSSPAAPCVMHANTQYIRPLILMNYSLGDGVADLDYIKVTKM